MTPATSYDAWCWTDPRRGARAVTYGLRRSLGLGVGAAEVWHAVPATLASNKRRAQRGGDPFAMTTALRTVWR